MKFLIHLLLQAGLISLAWTQETPQETALKAAQELFDKGEYKSALTHYRRFLKDDKKDPRAQAVQLMIAESLYESSYVKDKKKLFEEQTPWPIDKKIKAEYELVLDMNTASSLAESAQFRLNEMFYNAQLYPEAEKAWQNYLQNYPDGYLKGEALLALAEAHVMQREWEEAKIALKKLLEYNSAYGTLDHVLYLSGLIAFAQKRFDDASHEFESMREPAAAGLFYAGQCLMALGKPLLATQRFQDLIQNYPNHAQAQESYYLLAESFFAAQDYLSAIASFENFLRLYPESPYRYGAKYKIGLAYFARDQFVEARNTLQEVAETEADAASPKAEFPIWAQYIIGESYLKENRLRDASFAYGKTATDAADIPFGANALYKLSWCYYLKEDYAAGEANLNKLLVSYPRHRLAPYAQVMLGNTHTHTKNYRPAVTAYQKTVDTAFPDEIAEAALALANRAMVLDANYGSLISGYHLLLNNYPPSPNPWRGLTYLYIGEAYFRSNLYTEASNVYQSILKFHPTSQAAFYAQDGLAWSLFKLGRHQEAALQRQRLGGINAPATPAELLLRNDYELGNALFNQKKYTEALEKLEKFARDNPEHELAAEAYLRIGLCYTQLGYHGQAIETWQNLKEKYSASPAAKEAFWKIADTYFRAQKYGEAIGTYEDIMTRYPNTEDLVLAKLRVAQSYYNAQNDEAALEAFQNLILKHPDDKYAPESLDFLTTLLENQKHQTRALDAMQVIAKMLGHTSPIGAEAQLRIAQHYFDVQQWSEAAKALEELGGKFLPAKRLAQKEHLLGEAYYQQAIYKQAAGAFERLAANFPQDENAAFALFRTGSSYYKLEEYEKAARAFARTTSNFPNSEYADNSLYNAALSFKKAKLWEEAQAALADYMRLYPAKAKESQAREELAGIYQEQKNYAQAVKLLEEVRQGLEPSGERFGEITNQIAENYLLQGTESAAILEYEKAMSALSDSSPWRINAGVKLGDLYEKSGLWKEAVRVYQEIVNSALKKEWGDAAKARMDYIRNNHPEVFLK